MVWSFDYIIVIHFLLMYLCIAASTVKAKKPKGIVYDSDYSSSSSLSVGDVIEFTPLLTRHSVSPDAPRQAPSSRQSISTDVSRQAPSSRQSISPDAPRQTPSFRHSCESRCHKADVLASLCESRYPEADIVLPLLFESRCREADIILASICQSRCSEADTILA